MSNIQAHTEFWIDPKYHGLSDSSFNDAAASLRHIAQDEVDIGITDQHRTTFFSHGKPTDISVLLFNGLSGSTEELRDLGRCCFEQGMNVLIPNNPYHGWPDTKGSLGDLTTQALIESAINATHAAEGLGRVIYSAGISMGAGMSILGSLHSEKVDRVVAIAPSFGLKGLPDKLRPLAGWLLSRLPENDKFPILGWRAPGNSTHGTSAAGGIFLAAERDSRNAIHFPRNLLVVSSAEDSLVKAETNIKFFQSLSERGVHVEYRDEPALAKIMHMDDLKEWEKLEATGEIKQLYWEVQRHVAIDFGALK